MKRAQEAGAAGDARSAGRPWVPTPMPDAGFSRRLKLRRAAGATLLAIAAAGTVYLLMARPWRAETSSERPRAYPTPAASSPGSPNAAALPVVIVPTPPHARTSGDEKAAPQARPPERVAVSAPGKAPAPARAPHPPAEKTYAGSVTLPGGAKIELGGIVWSETEPRALLNDRVLGIGGYVEGYMVARIDTDRVALQKDGETIFVRVK